MFCGKCGANVPDGYEFCMKCGTKIDTSSVDTTETNVVAVKPEQKRINKKILISVVAAIVIVVAVLAIVFGMKGAAEKNGYFANIPWGTDIETVQKKVDKRFKCESEIVEDKDCVIAAIENYDGMKGVSAIPALYCEDKGTLNKVTVMFSVKDGSKYTGEKIAFELIEKYNKLFGKADSNKGYSYKWSTKNSTIELVFLSKDLIMLEFEK